jgi:transposase-like protein
MALLNASEVARRLGKTDKTVRQWIKDGKLHAVHISSKELGIEESDVLRLARHIGVDLPGPASSETGETERINRLEQEIARLRAELDTLRRSWRDLPVLAEQTQVTLGNVVSTLPNNSVDVHTFAAMHGIVNRGTVKHHYMVGIDGDLLDVTALAIPNRPGQYSRSLTSEQQRAALDYWQRHNVRNFVACPDCPHSEMNHEQI